MNRWKRKPNVVCPEDPREDLFFCHKCGESWPWFLYTKGGLHEFEDHSVDQMYYLLNDDKNRGGLKWACNYCIDSMFRYHSMIEYDSS
jgi:hypothetical protein